MAIITPDQGSVELERRSRISPADTYVRPSIPDVSTGFEQLSKALGGLGSTLEENAQRDRATQDQLDAQKVPYWVNQFSSELQNGVVDEVQIGKRLPTQSKLIVAKVLEGIGARQYEDWGRHQFDDALRGDPSLREDPVKRQAFFDNLRKQVVEQTKGRDFYGAGATRAVEGLINEYEGNFQREGAAQYNKQAEDDFKRGVGEAIKYPTAQTTHGQLLDFIGKTEAGGNYNAYYGNAGNNDIKFTNMSIADVMAWQKQQIAKGSPSSAVGKYQFISDTLANLVKEAGIDPNSKFDQATQDNLAEMLLNKAGAGAYEAGQLSKEEFANNLSKVWAALPMASGAKAGQSAYSGDGLNSAQTSLASLMGAIDAKGPSANPVLAIDKDAKATSPINNIRRRELMVDTAVDTAIQQRDPSVLDRIPTDHLLPEHQLKIEKARNEIENLKWTDYARSKQLNEDAQKAEMATWENDMVTRVAKDQPIDLYKDALGADGQVNAKKREFLMKLRESSNVSQADSSLAMNNLKDGLFTSATGGDYTKMFGNDTVLGPIVKAGKTPSADQIRDYVRRRNDINPADKEKLLGEVDTLMEGMSVIRDPMITTAYKDGAGQDVDAFLKSPQGQVALIKNPMIGSQVQAAFMNVVKREIQASIEEGNNIPRGKAKIEIIEKAEKAAQERLKVLTSAKPPPPPAAGNSPSTPVPKGHWEGNKFIRD